MVFSLSNPKILLFVPPLIAAWALSLGGVWLSIRLARWIDALDRPGHRSSHDRPTPRLGGLGIALGMLGGAGVCAAIGAFSRYPAIFDFHPGGAYWSALAAGGAVALFFGLADDLRGLPPWPKLICQCLCAAAPPVFGAGLRTIVLPGLGAVELGIAGTVLTALWIVFFMNVFNFMDGMDGYTGGFGLLACLALMAPPLAGVGMAPNRAAWVGSLFLLSGALLGFMRFNLARPAKTFMGDGGSQMIGYALALAALNAHPALVPGALIVFWPFIYDALYTLIRRARRGANLFEAHHEHLYQRLLEAGLSHAASRRRGAAFQLACLIASLGWAAASARGWSAWAHWLWWAVALGASALYTLDVWRIEARRRS